MGTIYNPSIVRDGLVLHLDAANVKSYPESGTTWFDMSENGLNFTMVGTPTWNSSGYFTGFTTGTYFECNNSTGWSSIMPIGDTPRTICALVYLANGSAYNHIIHWGTGGVSQQDYGLTVYNNSLSDHHWSTSNIGNISLVNGTNYFFSTRYNTTTYPGARFQVNNQFDTQTDITSDLSTGTSTLRIGSRTSTPVEFWDAGNTISLISVYNRDLSDDELLQNFKAMKGRYGL